MFIISDYIHPP